jgi:hypothetical protein
MSTTESRMPQTRKEVLANEWQGQKIEQITEEDVRFYPHPVTGVYTPSVTTYLDVLPNKDLQFWRDKVGADVANRIAGEAALSGTKVHNAIEDLSLQLLHNGTAELDWLDDFGNKKFRALEWEGVLRFVDFYTRFVDTILEAESRLVSEKHFVAGTVDLICVLKDGRVALIDHKFSNSLSDSYSVQTYVYKLMYEESSGVAVDVRGNLWLKAQTRGEDKKGKIMQGKGWKFVEHTMDSRDDTVWNCAKTLFLDMYRNKELLPEIKKYPVSIRL